jgi:predicted metalloendopeptidase
MIGYKIDALKLQALDMIHDIREAFNERLSDLEWMDEQTRAVAKEKVGKFLTFRLHITRS